MPSHDAHELTLLRSDGDSGSWPNVADPNTTGKRGYYVMVDLDEGASVNWRVKIGAHIAKYLDLPDGPRYILKSWPEGYMLFVHCKGNRRDKYLYGRMGIRYRSAAEFMPHAEWLSRIGEPAQPCGCHFCLRDKCDKDSVRAGKAHLQKPRSLPEKFPRTRTRGSANLIPNVSSRVSSGPRQNPLSGTPTSKNTTGCSPTHGVRKVLGCVRVAVPGTLPNTGSTPPTVVPWPSMHELVWCRLKNSITWTDAIIDFWPGVVKEGPKGPDEYLVTLLGSTCDVHVSLHAILPYKSSRVKEVMLYKLQSTRSHELLDLEGCVGVEMDDNRFSAISSAFSFAVSFSAHLARTWSWTASPDTGGSSASSMPRPVRRRLRSQKHTLEGYSFLWWGPERIEVRQLVQLKVSSSAISIDPEALAIPALINYPTELDKPIFLQIHSFSYYRKSKERGGRLTGPVVAGAIFDLVDEGQTGLENEDLPPPPPGKNFRPWLKESYEIVLSVAVIGNRYYWGTPEENISKHAQGSHTSMEYGKPNLIDPVTFRPTRMKMLEYAYEMSRTQAQSSQNVP